MRPCFKFSPAAKAAAAATLSIYDEIGFWGVQAKDFNKDLKAVEAKVLNVEINSPGGDVFAGIAIYNMLKNSGKTIHVKVMGVAASAASVIAMAGDKIEMPKNTFMMVHNPWSFAMGNADELRETADTLDKIGSSLVHTYAAKSGQTDEKIKEMLATDTWLTADEAKELGFADVVTDDVKAKASFDMKRAALPAHVQAALDASAAEPKEPPVEPIEDPAPKEPPEPKASGPLAERVSNRAKELGLEAYANILALRVADEKDMEPAMSEAREILSLCTVAGRADDAKAAIRQGTSVADVRAALVKNMAADDQHTNSARPANKSPAASAVKPAGQVYAERAARKQKTQRQGN